VNDSCCGYPRCGGGSGMISKNAGIGLDASKGPSPGVQRSIRHVQVPGESRRDASTSLRNRNCDHGFPVRDPPTAEEGFQFIARTEAPGRHLMSHRLQLSSYYRQRLLEIEGQNRPFGCAGGGEHFQCRSTPCDGTGAERLKGPVDHARPAVGQPVSP